MDSDPDLERLEGIQDQEEGATHRSGGKKDDRGVGPAPELRQRSGGGVGTKYLQGMDRGFRPEIRFQESITTNKGGKSKGIDGNNGEEGV